MPDSREVAIVVTPLAQSAVQISEAIASSVVISQKLDIDFYSLASLYGGMTETDIDERTLLIQGLLLEAGRLMEDASPEFARAIPDAPEPLETRIALLESTAQDLTTLAAASRTLLRLKPGGDHLS